MYFVINQGLTETFTNQDSMNAKELEQMTGATIEKSKRIGMVIKAHGKIIGRAFETKAEQQAYSEGA